MAVTGANGAVGRAILRAAPSRELVAVVRSERAAAEIRALADAARVVCVGYDDVAGLAEALSGATAVVHLVGILVERPGASYEGANVETTRRVVEAARRGGVAKLVFVSATGADPRSRNRYWRTKGEAEGVVRGAGIAHTILRVPILLGPGTEATQALRHRVAQGVVPLLGGGRTLQQPLAVDDLARAVLRACDPAVAADRTLELVGPTAVTDRQLVERTAHLTGRAPRIVAIPVPLVRLGAAIARRARGAGFGPDALEVLTTDTRLDPAPAARALGITLTPLEHTLREIAS